MTMNGLRFPSVTALKERAAAARAMLLNEVLPLVDHESGLVANLGYGLSTSWRDQTVLHRSGLNDASAVHLWWSLRWAGMSTPTFILTHSACAAMMLTELRSLRSEEVRLPYNALLITLPFPQPVLKIVGAKGSEEVVRWITLHRYAEASEADRKAHTGRAQRIVSPDDMSALGRVKIAAEAFALARSTPTHDAICVSALTAEGTIMATTLEEGMDIERRAVESQKDKNDQLAAVAMVRIAMNAMLYVTMQTRGGSMSKYGKPVGTSSRAPTGSVIGSEIKLSSEMIDAARDMSAGVARSRWRLRSRFLVRGHWRMQAAGPARSERHRRWIMPFWKGPEAGAELARIYRAEEFADVR